MDKNEINKKNKRKKEEISKVYGIDLKNIEQIKIKDKEFFKFVDNKTGTVKLLENINDDYNLSEQFKQTQSKYSSMQGSDGVYNAQKVFEFEKRHNKKELGLIPISSLCYLKDGVLYTNQFYTKLMDGLNNINKLEIKKLLQVSVACNLKYINIENAIAIDADNKVISSTYNEQKGICDINTATVLKFETDKVNVDKDNFEVDIENIDFDGFVEQIEVSNDQPIILAGEEIKKSDLEKYYEYPELIDRDQRMTNRRKVIIAKLIEAYKKKKEKRNTQTKENQKQKVLLKNNTGFVNELLFALIVGFASGVFLTIFLIIINANV